jgi:hypothetical protein
VALTHFWDFGWVLMGLKGNQWVLVTAMFGGTDPFWDFGGVLMGL